MDDVATLSKEQLIERLVDRDTMLAAKDVDLQTKRIELKERETELQAVGRQLAAPKTTFLRTATLSSSRC